ncbi:MAG: HAMP domain-containing sensor histidine kinase [Candidatus Acidiferrales bacterium]
MSSRSDISVLMGRVTAAAGEYLRQPMGSPQEHTNRLMKRLAEWPRSTWWVAAMWTLLVGAYAVAALFASRGPGLTAFGDIAQALAAGFGCVGLGLNAWHRQRRARIFWMLLTLGCAAWFAGQLLWTYFEVILHADAPNPFMGDVILFLHPVPMIGALAVRPHDDRDDLNVRVRYFDFSLLLAWWVFLYVFLVIPWQYIAPDLMRYGSSYNDLAAVENLVLTAGFGLFVLRTRGKWREIYLHLFSASLLYAAASYLSNRAIDVQSYYTGSVYDVPLVASFVWFGTAGIEADRLGLQPEGSPAGSANEPSPWPSRVARAAVISIPLMAVWSMWLSANPPVVRSFRVGVTQLVLVVAALLMFKRQSLVDRDRLRLVASSREALQNLQHFQTQMVQTEKLVSLGQLAAGAAHEINNPLTGILGYSDLLVDDTSLGERQRAVAEKIRALSRRIKTLVGSLLSFARQVPSERTELDVNSVIASALHLSNLDLRNTRIEVLTFTDSQVPLLRGDQNHLLQVMFNLISNAVDALEESGGGKLMLRTAHDGDNVIVEVSDTGPGIKAPAQVFDPFFTTKPVGKGTGLGLSICYGIVQDHGGKIECYNRPEGGATFKVTLPHALAAAREEEMAAVTRER